MPDMPGDTFVNKGIEYVLRLGPKGNLRPYTVGPAGGAIARKGATLLPKLDWAGLAIGVAAAIGAVIWRACSDDE